MVLGISSMNKPLEERTRGITIKEGNFNGQYSIHEGRGLASQILGEGSERGPLLDLADKQGIRNVVSIPGFKKNPYAWMKRADLFVLSSRWEGFGHVIVEAMACGVPVLATRCRSGPDEIITDGADGRLCRPESVDDLAEKIGFLVDNPLERKRLAEAGLVSANRYDTGIIVKQYENMFKRLFAFN